MQSSVMHPAILSYLIETVCCKIHSVDHCGRRLNRGAVVSRSFSSFRQVILLKDMAALERPDGGKFGRCGKSCGAGIRNNLLLVLLITAAVVGLVIGVLVNPPVNRIKDPEKRASTIMLLSFPGELLLNMLRMIILPLVIASLITAVAGLNATEAGKIGRRTLIYYLSTMVLAALLGVLLALTIKPGKEDKPGKGGPSFKKMEYRNLDSILDVIRYAKSIL